MNDKVTVNSYKCSNFIGTEEELYKEMNDSVIIRKNELGCCWLSSIDGVCYLKYSVSDLFEIKHFIEENREILNRNNIVLEICSSKCNYLEKRDLFFHTLNLEGFLMISYHIAYEKTYLKNLNNNSPYIIVLNEKDISLLEKLYLSVDNSYKNISFNYISQLFENPNYIFHGYYENNELLGVIIINVEKNVEQIGFISFIILQGVESVRSLEQNEMIIIELVRSAINLFALKGYQKAFIWSDFNLPIIMKSIEHFGFKPLNKENIVFTKIASLSNRKLNGY